MRKAADPAMAPCRISAIGGCLADQPEHTDKRNHGLNTLIPSPFEKWLMQYRDRLAKVVHDKTNTTNGQ
jgi:hypothetical protein